MTSNPVLTIVGATFAPGDVVTGTVRFARLESAIQVIVEIRGVDLVQGTKIYRHPLAVEALTIEAGVAHPFVLAIPRDALTRDDALAEEPIEASGWEVVLRIALVDRASRAITIHASR